MALDLSAWGPQYKTVTDGATIGGYTLQNGIVYQGNGQPIAWPDLAENSRYIAQGLLDPRLKTAVAGGGKSGDVIGDFLARIWAGDPLEAAWWLGKLDDRGTYSTGSGDPYAFNPSKYWPSVFGASTLLPNEANRPYYDDAIRASAEMGLNTTSNEQSGGWWKGYMSASAQSARDDPDDGFLGLGDFGNALALAGVALGGYFGLESLGMFGGAEAAGAVAASEFVPVGAMSIPGTYGAMSSTAALAPSISGLTPVVSGLSMGTGASLAFDLASNGAASWLTLQNATSAVNTASKAVNAAGTVAKLAGSSAASSPASLLPFSLSNSQGGYMKLETPQGMPQSGATPQNIIPPNNGDSLIGPLLLLGLGLILYLVK